MYLPLASTDSCIGLPSLVNSQLVSLIEKAAGTAGAATSFAATSFAAVRLASSPAGAAGLEHAASAAIAATRTNLCTVFSPLLEERAVTGFADSGESSAECPRRVVRRRARLIQDGLARRVRADAGRGDAAAVMV